MIVLTNENNLYEFWSLNAIAEYKSKVSFKQVNITTKSL